MQAYVSACGRPDPVVAIG